MAVFEALIVIWGLYFVIPLIAGSHGRHGADDFGAITPNMDAQPIEPTEIMKSSKEHGFQGREVGQGHGTPFQGQEARFQGQGNNNGPGNDPMMPNRGQNQQNIGQGLNPLQGQGEVHDRQHPRRQHTRRHHHGEGRRHQQATNILNDNPQIKNNPAEEDLLQADAIDEFFNANSDNNDVDPSESTESSGYASYNVEQLQESWENMDSQLPGLDEQAIRVENSIGKEYIPHFKPTKQSQLWDTTTITPRTTTTEASPTMGLEDLMKTSLESLVFSLQDQLNEAKNTQSTTRSIINVLEERAQAQERNLAQLKDELKELSAGRQEDKQVLDALKTMVADAAWGVNDIKLAQHQLREDFSNMKSVQSDHNDTVNVMEEFVGTSEENHQAYDESIRHLRSEVLTLRTEMYRERATMNRAILTMQQKLYNLKPTETRVDENIVQSKHWPNANHGDVVRPKYTNKINNAPSGSTEHSGDSSKEPKFDSKSATIEETKNTIGNDIQEIRRNENTMKKEIGDVQQKFLQYDSELSKIYALFYNLSLNMANLENKLLTKQQSQHAAEIHDLQKSFLNFTQQVFHLEQSHMTNKAFFNTSSQNEREIQQISTILDNHSSRLRNFEDTMRDYKGMTQQNYLLFMSYVDRLNQSIAASHHKIHRHQDKATGVFGDVDEQLEEMSDMQRHNSDRLYRVEVKVLNASLMECQRASADMAYNVKLSEMSRVMDKMDDRVDQHLSKVSRLDKGVSQLFDIAEKQTGTVNSLVDQLTNLWELIPDVRNVQKEVNHFLTQLPTDCDDIMRSEPYHPDRVYLVKPTLSVQSVLVPCTFTEDREAWTTLQRRTDGKTTFTRTWKEYKEGFGEPKDEFWIGNDNIYFLTNQKNYLLRIDLWDMSNTYYYADYNLFRVESEDALYKLHINEYRGNATDAMKYSNLMPFSTPDKDNDVSSTHCAKFYTAGWWYKHCHYGNLNGRFTVGVVWFNHDLDEWVQMSRTEMRIRPITTDINRTTG